MIVLVLALLLFAVAGILMLCLRVRAKIAFSSATFLALLWIWLNGCGTFSAIFNNVLHTSRWPNHVDSATLSKHPVIVLLGSGTEREKNGWVHPRKHAMQAIELSARLYQDAVQAGAEPLVIISGGDPMRHGMAEADNYAPYLLSLGLPDHAIVRENKSQNTYQNAQFVAAILSTRQASSDAASKHEPASILLVTSASHMQRSLLDFAHFGMQAQPVAPISSPFHWSIWPNRINMEVSATGLHELGGIAQFYVYRALHLY